MKRVMNKWSSFCLACAVLLVSLFANAQEQGVVRPQIVVREIVQGMPRREKQEVRVVNVNFQPRDRTLFHTHRFPVTVYVLEVSLRWKWKAAASNSDPLRLVAFYVSDPDTPLLDPIQPR